MKTSVNTDHAAIIVESPWQGTYTEGKTRVVVDAPGLTIAVTTLASGRHWIELLEVGKKTTLVGPGDTVVETPWTGDVAWNYEPKGGRVRVVADDSPTSPSA